MERNEQKRVIQELGDGIVRDLLEMVFAGKIPEAWDGHELRALFAAKAGDAASISTIVRQPRSARAREFRNHVLVNYL